MGVSNPRSTAVVSAVTVVALVAMLFASGVAAAPATVSSSGPTSADPGDSVTVSVTLTNTGDGEDNYIADVSIPSGWSVDGHSDDGGTWNGGDRSWLWQNLGAGDSVTPSITVTVPSGVDDGSYTIETTAKSSDGVEDTTTHTVTIGSTSSGDDGATDDGSSGGGGAGGGTGGGATDSTESETAPTDETSTNSSSSEPTNETSEESANASTESDGEPADASDEVEPDASTRTELPIEDADTDGEGVTVETGTDSVDRITFDDESITGTVEITEYQTPPEGVTDGIAAAVDDASDTGTAETESGSGEPDAGDDRQTAASDTKVVSVTDISPSADSDTSTAATVTLTVDRDRLTEPTNAYVMHESADGWERLETTVEERSDDTVTLEARTESFSLFAVVETTAQSQQTDDTGDSSEPSSEPSTLPIRLAGIVLLGVLLVGAGLLLRS